MQIIQSIKENITLENVKKSDYWNLIAILVWGHYSEKKYQNEDDIEISESWYGKNSVSSSYHPRWNNPNHSEKAYVRTLDFILIKLATKYHTTHITISMKGNISCYGFYYDKEEKTMPTYNSAQRNIEKTNWLLKNNFLKVININ